MTSWIDINRVRMFLEYYKYKLIMCLIFKFLKLVLSLLLFINILLLYVFNFCYKNIEDTNS